VLAVGVAEVVVVDAGVVVLVEVAPAAGVVATGVVVAAAGVVVSGVVVPAAGVVAAVEVPVEELLGAVVEELEAGVELVFEDDCWGISSAKKVVVVVPGVDAEEDPEVPEVDAICAASS